jgi:hypothetical protein
MDARSSTPTERRRYREAQSAAQRQRALALRQAGATYAAIGRELGVTLERARQIVFKAERLALDPRWYDALPERAVHVLRAYELLDRPEFEVARALAQLSVRELMQRANFGRISLNALGDWLAGHGLKLQPKTKSGGSGRSRPHDSDSPFAPGRNQFSAPCPYKTSRA